MPLHFVGWDRPDLSADYTQTMKADPADPGNTDKWEPYNRVGVEATAASMLMEAARTMATVTGSVGSTHVETIFGVEITCQWLRKDPRLADTA